MLQQRCQPSANEDVVTVAFAAPAPHTPVEEPFRTLKDHVSEAAWMEIESQCPGEAFVSHTETSLKFGTSRQALGDPLELLHDPVPGVLRLDA